MQQIGDDTPVGIRAEWSRASRRGHFGWTPFCAQQTASEHKGVLLLQRNRGLFDVVAPAYRRTLAVPELNNLLYDIVSLLCTLRLTFVIFLFRGLPVRFVIITII